MLLAMRAVALVVLLLGVSCGSDARRCTSADQCRLGNGGLGQCLQGFCAYNDPSCPLGLRWDERAAKANTCVPAPDAALPDAPDVDGAGGDSGPDTAVDGGADAAPGDATSIDGAAADGA